jgi:hypothetical protein
MGQADNSVTDFATATINGGAAPISSGANNLIRNASNFGGSAINVDPKLGALTVFGKMSVVPLQIGSPAINGGVALGGVTTDQRGIARGQWSV